MDVVLPVSSAKMTAQPRRGYMVGGRGARDRAGSLERERSHLTADAICAGEFSVNELQLWLIRVSTLRPLFRRVPSTRKTVVSQSCARLDAPKVFEPLLAQFRISRGVLNGAMAEPILNGPDIVTLVCQSVAAGVPQHVHMDLERKAGPLAYPFD
jgi:hypothetical protein